MPISKSFIHPITQAYFDKIEATGGIVIDKASVNKFVIQMCKIVDPGSWMAIPMTSAHNIGTGSTVYVLGNSNWNNYNLTLINGPAWGTTGIVKNASNQTLDIPRFRDIYTVSAPGVFWVGQASGSTGFSNLRPYLLGDGNPATTFSQPFYSTDVAAYNARSSRDGGLGNPSSVSFTGRNFLFNFLGVMEGNSLDFVQANGTTGTVRTGIGPRIFTGGAMDTASLMLAGTYGTNSSFFGIYSIFIFVLIELTPAQCVAIYNAYKNTIGVAAGLGLP